MRVRYSGRFAGRRTCFSAAKLGAAVLALGFSHALATSTAYAEGSGTTASGSGDDEERCRLIRAQKGQTPEVIDEVGPEGLENLPIVYEERLLPEFRTDEKRRNECLAYVGLGPEQAAAAAVGAGLAPQGGAAVGAGLSALPLPVIGLGAAAIIGGGLAIGLGSDGGGSGTSTTSASGTGL